MQGCAYLQKQTTSQRLKWPQKDRQFREKWDTFDNFAKGSAGGDSALLKMVAQPPWKQSVTTPQVLLLLPWGKIRFLYIHRQSCKVPNPHEEILSLTQVQLLMCHAVSPALNTTLLFSSGSCSWFSQGSHKSNVRTYSNLWSWGDENSTSAHSKRFSWPQVMSLIGLISVLSYMITWHQKTYSNISPVIFCSMLGQAQWPFECPLLCLVYIFARRELVELRCPSVKVEDGWNCCQQSRNAVEKYYLNGEFTGTYVSNVGFKNILNLGIS